MGAGAPCCSHEEQPDSSSVGFDAADYVTMEVDPNYKPPVQKQECWFSFIYSKYIPFMVRDRFKFSQQKLSSPESEEFEGAVAFVDISGFTKLSEKLQKEYGSQAGEKLNRFISSYFDRLIRVIVAFGGDIIKFAGDAMLVVWRNPAQPQQQAPAGSGVRQRKDIAKLLGHKEMPLRVLVLRAVLCNLTLLSRHNNFRPPGLPADSDVCLKLHTGIGAGKIFGIFVGGVDDMWEFFVAGQPIQQMSDAGDEAKSGDVVLSKEAFAQIQDIAIGVKRKNDLFKIVDIKEKIHVYQFIPPQITVEQREALTGFVPMAVKKHVDAGHSTRYLPEYRHVFIMFVVLPLVNYDAAGFLEFLQNGVQQVQRAVFKYEGTIARLLADDKGTRFKVAFGMPSMHHEDDGVRVVRAALEIAEGLTAMGHASAIGIATGLVFCGEAGSQTRCEYTAVGNKVIIAARLMQTAGKMGNIILCDEETYHAAHAAVHFEVKNPVRLKGVSKLVPVFQPTFIRGRMKTKVDKALKLMGLADDTDTVQDAPRSSITMDDLGQHEVKELDASAPMRRRRRAGRSSGTLGSTDSLRQRLRRRSSIPGMPRVGDGSLAGRTQEVMQLRELLGKVIMTASTTRETFLVLIEGEGGMGKTALVSDFMAYVESAQLDFLYGRGDAQESKTAYFPFRNIFEALCGTETLHPTRDRKARNLAVQSCLDPAGLAVAALLNPILATSFPDAPHLQRMNADLRADKTQVLLLQILMKKVEGGPRVLILEDMQHYDSASWALTYDICQHVPNLLLVLTMRKPTTRPYPANYKKIRHLSMTKCISLGMLSKEETSQLAAMRFGVSDMPETLGEALYSKTQGHPLYVDELCQALLSQKLVTVEDGVVSVDPTIERDKKLESIDAQLGNVKSLIVGRIERLGERRLTLLICSVIGQEVHADLVKRIHPAFKKFEDINNDLIALEEAGFLTSTSGDGADDEAKKKTYAFKHSMYEEAAVDLLAGETRLQIHRNIAEYMSAQPNAEDDVANFGVIAHHFTGAEEWENALLWTRKAGKYATNINANREAVKYYQQALEILTRKSASISDGHGQAVLEVQACLGNALYAMGRCKECIPHLRAALTTWGIDIAERNSKGFLTGLLKPGLQEFLQKSAQPVGGKPDAKDEDEFDTIDDEESKVDAYSSDDEKGPNMQEIDEAVPVLEKMARACTLSGLWWQAGFAAFHVVQLGQRIENKAVLCLGYSMCAYACLELGWGTLADKFDSKAQYAFQQLVRFDTPAFFSARINFQRSLFLMSVGQWKEAFDSLQTSLQLFYEHQDSKRWRECNFHRAICMFYLNDLNGALGAFHDVMISAQKDGDMYFEAQALYWKSLMRILTYGGSDENYRDIRAGLSLVADLQECSKVPHAILLTVNGYLMQSYKLKSVSDTAESGLEQYRKLVELNLNDDNLDAIVSRRGGLTDAISYLQFASLLLDAVETQSSAMDQEEADENGSDHMSLMDEADLHFHVSSKSALGAYQMFNIKQGSQVLKALKTITAKHNPEEKKLPSSSTHLSLEEAVMSSAPPKSVLRRGAWRSTRNEMNRPLLEAAEKIVKAFASYSKVFKFAKPMQLLLHGRLLRLQNSHKQALQTWLTALALAERLQVDWIAGLIHFEVGRHATDAKEGRKHLHKVVCLFNQRNVLYLKHPYFSAIRQLFIQMESADVKPKRLRRRDPSKGHRKGAASMVVTRRSSSVLQNFHDNWNKEISVNAVSNIEDAYAQHREWGRRDSFRIGHMQTEENKRRMSLSRAGPAAGEVIMDDLDEKSQ